MYRLKMGECLHSK